MTPGQPRSLARTLALVAIVALLLVGLNLGLQRWKQYRTDDRAAIREVLDAQERAWNAGDLEGFMVGYWNSPNLTFFSGKDEQAGWQATIDRYRKRYQAEGKEMGQLAFTDVRIEQTGPTHAWVRGRWQLTRGKENPGGLFTLVFERLPEGWRIVHDHTSD